MIESLTDEQVAKFPYYVDKWIKIGTSTGECDFDKSVEAIKKCYKLAGLEPPPVFLGPFDCPVSAAIEDIKYESEMIGEKPVLSKENIVAKINNQIYGSMDAYWLSFYDFFREEFDIDLSILDGLMGLVHHCGWWTPYKEVAILQHKPEVIKFKDKVLHCDDGPAIKYRGKYIELYYLNGVRMKKEHVMTPAEKIDPKSILAEANVEIRRELTRKVGIERMLEALDAKVLDKKGNYELLDVRLSDEVPHARYLKMTNPSIGVFHVEGVEGDTVEQAINFRARNVLPDEGNWNPSILT